MNLLLDAHVFIWAVTDDPSLSTRARSAIVDGRNLIYVSAVAALEIAIKRSLGKLKAPQDYLDQLAIHRFTPLDITARHALALEHLPGHHNDPFDRLLIAQAQLESMTLVTRDRRFKAYDVPIIDA